MAAHFTVATDGLVRTTHIIAPTSDMTARGWFFVPTEAGAGTDHPAIWVQLDSAVGYNDWIYVGLIQDDNTIELSISTGTSTLGPAVSVGWHRWAYVRKGHVHTVYIDGVVSTTQTVDVSGYTIAEEYLGTDTYASDWGRSYAFGVREWSAALTASELAREDANDNGPVRAANLWLDTPLLSDGLDRTGLGGDWSLYDAATITPIEIDVIEAHVEAERYSDLDMQDPASWYGGFKDGVIQRFGEATRTLSDPRTGDWQGAQYSFTVNDPNRTLREQIVSPRDRYWSQALTQYMTTRANRAVLGNAWPVFVGPIVQARPVPPLAWEITLGDIVSRGLLSDQVQVPFRVVGDGIASARNDDGTLVMKTLAESLDLTTPEPIVYGRHVRMPDDPDTPLIDESDPASPEGFAYPPTYLGTRTVDGNDYHVWLLAGHALADVMNVLVDRSSVLASSDWVIPHTPAFETLFDGNSYEDFRSSTYGDLLRYTLLYGLVGATGPEACASGESELLVFMDGVEPNGDGTGTVELKRLNQYKHFMKNYGARQGQGSYRAGAWLTSPTWSVYGTTVPIIDETSFDACDAIGDARLPSVSNGDSPETFTTAGYLGAAIIGGRPGDRRSLLDWIAAWNRSCGVRCGMSNQGQYRVVMLHPTQAAKAAAPLYTGSYEIAADGFSVDLRYDQQANRIPFVADWDWLANTYRTQDVAVVDAAVINYERDIIGEQREYNFAPGITASYHLARLEALACQHPPILVTLTTRIGPDYGDQSLAYLELGDYVRYTHVGAVGQPNQIRLAQIETMTIHVGDRTVTVVARDCEDLIDYDAAPEDYPALETPNDSCAEAIALTNVNGEAYAIDLNTSLHADDATAGQLPDDRTAYGAAFWSWTAPANGTVLLTTVHSEFNTQLQLLEGTCGSLSRVDGGYNDNDGIAQTSILELPVTMGTDYVILVSGVTALDKGNLTFGFLFTETGS